VSPDSRAVPRRLFASILAQLAIPPPFLSRTGIHHYMKFASRRHDRRQLVPNADENDTSQSTDHPHGQKNSANMNMPDYSTLTPRLIYKSQTLTVPYTHTFSDTSQKNDRFKTLQIRLTTEIQKTKRTRRLNRMRLFAGK